MITQSQRKKLNKLIKAYAEVHAQSYWQDDQGTGDYVKIAHENEKKARAKLQKYLSSLTTPALKEPPY